MSYTDLRIIDKDTQEIKLIPADIVFMICRLTQ